MVKGGKEERKKGRKEERKEMSARGKEGSDRMQSFNLSVSLFLFLFFCFSGSFCCPWCLVVCCLCCLVVSCDTDTIYLYDLGSTNGTFLDEVRIPSLTKVEIRDGAILSFGGSTRTYTLKWHEGLKVSGQNHHIALVTVVNC